MSRRHIGDLADTAYLKNVWRKRVRSGMRKMPLPSFVLCHDPLEYLAFDWELDALVANLVNDLQTGSYRAHPAEILRAAKSVGLTRPLSFIAPRDLVVYIGLIQIVENSLLSHMLPWVRFGRAQSTRQETNATEESGWFRAWLKRQNQIWTITNNHTWIVQSDVANFFASLSIDALTKHVNNSVDADAPLVGLLTEMLQQFSPIVNYRRSSIGGLPQENFDGSRVLAHTYLRPLDEQFRSEGSLGRYTRWVDDLVVGTDTWAEALQVVRRIQEGLEALDLFPNSSKTKITRRRSFAKDLMKEENDYIGQVEEQVNRTGRPSAPNELRRRIIRHARSAGDEKAWERVLRRYYSLSRNIGETALMAWWYKHISTVPSSAAPILEYLTAFRLTQKKLDSLANLLDQFGNVYEDIDLLAREYVLRAPNINSRSLRTTVCDWALKSLEKTADVAPRVAAADALVLAKFGYRDHFGRLLSAFDGIEVDSAARQQLAVILYSVGLIDDHRLMSLLHDSSPETAQHIRYLQALAAGHRQAINPAFSMAQPVERTSPPRWVLRPRPMILIPLLASKGLKPWRMMSVRWCARLRSNDPRMLDAAALRWSSGDLQSIIVP